MNHRFIGYSTDGRMLFQDLDQPSDALQPYIPDAAVRACFSPDCIDAESHELIRKVIEGEKGIRKG